MKIQFCGACTGQSWTTVETANPVMMMRKKIVVSLKILAKQTKGKTLKQDPFGLIWVRCERSINDETQGQIGWLTH